MLHHGIVKDWVRWEFVSSRTEFKTSLYKKKRKKTSPPDNSQSLLFHDPPLAGQAAAEPPGQSAAPRGSSAAVLPPPPPAGTTNYPDTPGARRTTGAFKEQASRAFVDFYQGIFLFISK